MFTYPKEDSLDDATHSDGSSSGTSTMGRSDAELIGERRRGECSREFYFNCLERATSF